MRLAAIARMAPRIRFVALLTGLAALLTPIANGQPPDQGPIKYRRIFVPQDDLQSQIEGLLPMKREQFEQRILEASRRADGPAAATEARIERASYAARFDGQDLVDGTAELKVVASANGQTLLPLSPCNLALRDARWSGGGEEESLPAMVGQTADGRPACLLGQSGTLMFAWSARGTSLPGSARQFSLQMPPAASSLVTLDLPQDHRPILEGAIAVGNSAVNSAPASEDAKQGEDESEDEEEDEEEKDNARRTWQIAVAGPGRVLLTIQRVAAGEREQPLVAVRETSTYSVPGSALDLQSQFALNLLGQAVNQLTLRVERPLEVTAIRLADKSPTWRTLASDDKATTIAIDLSAPLEGEATLEVEATAPWMLDPPATLPRIAVVDGVYQEGRTTLVAPGWLRIQARPITDCWQTSIMPAAPGRSADQLQFQLQSPTAAIELSAESRRPSIRERSGTQITVDATHVTAVTIAELTPLYSDQYVVEARIPRRWLVDAVDVEPADAVSDRTLVPGSETAGQLLRLNLRTPLAENRPLIVTIRARHRRPAGNQSLGEKFFRVATFADVQAAERLVALRTVDSGEQFRVLGSERLTRLEPGSLSEQQMRLFESPPTTLLFVDDDDAGGVAVELTRAAARYRAELQMEGFLQGTELRETVVVRCLPEASAVGQVVVRLSPKPPSSVKWTVAGQDDVQLEVEPLERAAGVNSNDAMVRIRLSSPRSSAFELLGEWTRPVEPAIPITLASAPEATSQTGLVELHELHSAAFKVDPDGLQAQLVPTAPPDEFTTLRARYTYQPGRQASPRLTALSAREVAPAAVVESLVVHSRFDAGGIGEHEAVLEIENQGLAQLLLQISAAAHEIRQFDPRTGDVSPVARPTADTIAIDLPPGRRRSTVALRYRSTAVPLGWRGVGSFSAPLPETDLPVLSRRWIPAIGPELRFSFPAPENLASAAQDHAFRGWSALSLELPAGNTASIEVYRPAIVQALAVGLTLFIASLAFWIGRPALLLSGAVLLLAASLLASPVAQLLMQGVVAGLVLAALPMLLLVSRLPQRVLSTPARTQESTARRVREFAGWLLLAICGWAAWCAAAMAQDQPAAPANNRKAEQRVVLPVDSDQEPVGDYVYVTPELYERLHQGADAAATKLPDWIITAAHYELPRAPSAAGESFSIDQIRANYELETFRDAVVMELPLQREQVLLLEGQARLDGAGVTLSWRDDGTALRVAIEQPGSHRLELAFGAEAKKVDAGVLLDVRIPVVSNSTATLPAGAGQPATVVSALGGSQAGESADIATALGPAENLSVLWPPTEGAQAAARLEAEQLLWWKLRPGSVVAEGKFRFRPLGGAAQRFSIAVDPRLRLLPGSIAPAAARTWVEEGSPATVHIELAEATSSEVTVSASWLWVGVSGTGNLLLPPIQANGDRLVRSWRAVSAEPPLVVTAERPAASALKPADFLIAWSEPAAEPALASDELMSGAAVAVVSAPAASQPEAATTADWSFSDQKVNLRFSASLSQVPLSQFQHRLELPPLLKVSRVEITAAGDAAPLRWDQRANGSLVITLLAAPPAEHQLVVEAQARLGDRARWALPAVELEGATVSQQLCRLYRNSDAQVRLQNTAGWNAEEASLIGHRTEGLGRLVAALQSEAAAAKPLSVQLSPNRPAVSGRLALRMFEDDGAWSAEADLSLQVGGGVLDSVRLELPEAWSGPFEINPAVEHRVQALAGTSRRELWIWPQQSVADQARFTLRGPVKTSGGQPVQTPSIRLPEVESLERLLVLDTRFGGEALEWETSGLEAASSASLPPEWTAGGEEVYRIVSDQFAASPLVTSNVQRTPQVRLSEIRLIAQPANRAIGRASFFIDPAGAAELELAMPPGSRLVQLTINGHAAQCRAVGLRSWRVATPAPRLPLLLEVVYDSALPADPGGQQPQTLIVPRLAALTPELSAWRLVGLEPVLLKSGSQVAGGVEAELARLEACGEAVAQLADISASDLPPEALALAWRGWMSQFRSSEGRLRAYPEEQRGRSDQFDSRLQVATKRALSTEQKLIEAGVLTPATAADVPPIEGSPLWSDQAAVAVLAREPGNGISVRRSSESPSSNPSRWTLALGILALGGAGWTALRSQIGQAWLVEHAHLVLALAGLSWWLFAPLPWLGWIAVALAVWLAFRPPWTLRPQAFL